MVVGLGNRMRRDDAAGLEVVDLLREMPREQLGAAVRLCRHEGEGLDLLSLWEGSSAVVLVDAVEGGEQPGRVIRFDASRAPVPVRAWGSASTHAIGAAEAIELARAMNTLPARVVLYGVIGERFEAGEGLSAAVRAAVPAVAGRIAEELAALRG